MFSECKSFLDSTSFNFMVHGFIEIWKIVWMFACVWRRVENSGEELKRRGKKKGASGAARLARCAACFVRRCRPFYALQTPSAASVSSTAC